MQSIRDGVFLNFTRRECEAIRELIHLFEFTGHWFTGLAGAQFTLAEMELHHNGLALEFNKKKSFWQRRIKYI